jgi:methyltransferase family protein
VDDHDVTDWHSWHAAYADPESPLSQRLRVVQSVIDGWLERRSGPASVVSLCAGEGRDLLDVLERRPDAARVRATLVELQPDLAARARDRAAKAGLDGVDVRCGDAATAATYEDRLPADLVLLCGVFGNISDRDIQRTVGALPAMVRPGGSVIWTRSRRSPDVTPAIRSWLGRAGFREREFVAPDGTLWSVGVHDLMTPAVIRLPKRLFTFEV